MGGGSWTENTRTLYSKMSATAKSSSINEVFTRRKIDERFDPRNILFRESVDSEDNPESTAIIVALDVTGSMGILAHEMAKDGLGKLVANTFDRKPVTDPHVMCMAVGDAVFDSAPLQVTQFEADIRIAEQLTDLYIEGGGGGNGFESYDVPWHFAGNHTKIDCFDKRGKKGYLFTVGDEPPPPLNNVLSESNTRKVYQSSDVRIGTPAESLAAADKQYHVFHLIVEEGYFAKNRPNEVLGGWRELLGNRAILLSDYHHMAEVIVSLMHVSEGQDPEEVINSWEDPNVAKTVRRALEV